MNAREAAAADARRVKDREQLADRPQELLDAASTLLAALPLISRSNGTEIRLRVALTDWLLGRP